MDGDKVRKCESVVFFRATLMGVEAKIETDVD